MKYDYIVIEGTIGAGKTTLAKKIAADYSGRLILEQFKDNSFLPKFYREPDKFAFPLEMSFLADRFQQLKSELGMQDMFTSFTIADYFFSKSLIFARQNLQDDVFRLFNSFFSILNNALPQPGIILYLYAGNEKLLRNIKKRGRTYESGISSAYLDAIQRGYLDHFRGLSRQRIIVVDTEDIDFVSKPSDYRFLVSLLEKSYSEGVHYENISETG